MRHVRVDGGEDVVEEVEIRLRGPQEGKGSRKGRGRGRRKGRGRVKEGSRKGQGRVKKGLKDGSELAEARRLVAGTREGDARALPAGQVDA